MNHSCGLRDGPGHGPMRVPPGIPQQGAGSGPPDQEERDLPSGGTEKPEGPLCRSGGQVTVVTGKAGQGIIAPEKGLPAQDIDLLRGFQVHEPLPGKVPGPGIGGCAEDRCQFPHGRHISCDRPAGNPPHCQPVQPAG